MCRLKSIDKSQLSLIDGKTDDKKAEALGIMRDNIRKRYGWSSLQKGIMLTNRELALINPACDNSIQKIAFYRG